MLSYDDLVDGLEDAWIVAALHNHELVEHVQPENHERTYKAGLMPEYIESLNEESMPPWVEVSFTWTALHQLHSEGRCTDTTETDPLDLTWVYNVIIRSGLRERSDQDLVRMFQRAVDTALKQCYPAEVVTTAPVAVEVRRVYQYDGETMNLVYVQLVSPNITDLSDQWSESDPRVLEGMLQSEVDLAGTVLRTLMKTFYPDSGGGRGTYRSVDTA